ncbi:MAG: hypothetical protein AAF937_12495 [Planctomycetota bacterium]
MAPEFNELDPERRHQVVAVFLKRWPHFGPAGGPFTHRNPGDDLMLGRKLLCCLVGFAIGFGVIYSSLIWLPDRTPLWVYCIPISLWAVLTFSPYFLILRIARRRAIETFLAEGRWLETSRGLERDGDSEPLRPDELSIE